jgi:hypothetical protein
MYTRRQKIPLISLNSMPTEVRFLPNSHNHVEAFQTIVKYLVKLRRDGDIDNDTFEGLVKQTASNFVETEISERIDRVLESKISLDRLLELL